MSRNKAHKHDGAMTHWRPDKRAHGDGLDDFSTASMEQPGWAVAFAKLSNRRCLQPTSCRLVRGPTAESVEMDCLGKCCSHEVSSMMGELNASRALLRDLTWGLGAGPNMTFSWGVGEQGLGTAGLLHEKDPCRRSRTSSNPPPTYRRPSRSELAI